MGGESVDRLMARGFELLEALDFDRAVKVGNQLLSRRHTSGFEILALAHSGLGDTERAVKILEDGVEKGPTVWVLWQLLGNYRSDLGRYAEAHVAYEKALECPQANKSSVHLNMAIALSRQGRSSDAMIQLQLVEDKAIQTRVESQRLQILNDQGKYDEAIRHGEQVLALLESEEDDEVRSGIETSLGEAYWRGQGNGDRALELAWQSLAHSRGSQNALWLIRQVEGQVSQAAVYYRILVEGDWPEMNEDGSERGFFIMYDVVADSVEEAMTYVRRCESDDIGPSLRANECEVLGPRPTDPKGVYQHQGYHLFPREAEDD